MNEIIGSDGTSYCIRHLAPTSHTFGLRLNGSLYDLPIQVVYGNHCYTRSPKDGDESSFSYRDGADEARIFCRERWDYSHQLPGLVTAIMNNDSHCHPTSRTGLYFKVDRVGFNVNQNPNAGWHLFFEFSPIHAGPGVRMQLRSNHPRETKPHNARGKPVRFRFALTDYLKDRPELLKGVPAKEVPQK